MATRIYNQSSGDMAAEKRTVPISIPAMSPDRPQSALARGVKITEFSSGAREMNPEPIVPEESEYLLEEYLSPRKLKLLTGMDNLEEVHFLEMKVDTRDTSLGNFGMHLPNLSQLKLSNSIITQTRDLGTCLENVRVLWMAQCGLEDIDGLSSMHSLRELYLAYNEITDISPCSMLEHLQILDLEGNAISDITQVEFLALCMKLENLTLDGNPICTTPNVDQTSKGYNYRLAVKRAVPHLAILDDEPLTEDAAAAAASDPDPDPTDDPQGERAGSRSGSAAIVFEDDWNLINEFYRDGTIMDRDEVLEEELLPAPRPGTSSIRPATGYRPGSALKPYTATLASRSSRHGSRPGTGAFGGPGGSSRGSSRGSSSRPGTGNVAADEGDVQQDDSSALTQGGVLCGNLTKALLRSRKAADQPATHNRDALKFLAKMKAKTENSANISDQPDLIPKELKEEIEKWKNDYQKQREKIQATKAPQILTISYGGDSGGTARDMDADDAISLSGDEDESIDSGSETGLDDDFDLSLPPGLMMKQEEQSSPLPDSGISSDQGYDGYGARPKHQVGVSPTAPNRRRHRLRTSDDFLPPSSLAPHTPPSPPVAPINGQTPSSAASMLRSPSPLLQRAEPRPTSGPDGKIKLNPVIDKARTKVIDLHNPIVRALPHSPDRPDSSSSGPLRSSGPRSSQGSQPSMRVGGSSGGGMRSRGQLANVALLPSKPPPSFVRSDSSSTSAAASGGKA